MAFDQNGSTWLNQYHAMNSNWGSMRIDAETSTILNPILIVLLVPIFSKFVYPTIESRFGRFRLLDRMLVGMFLSVIAFIVVGIIQIEVDKTKDAGFLIYNEKGMRWDCPEDPVLAQRCVHGAWQILPYFIITCGEVLFSISGLNFTYEEVGSRMKASAASLWLLMVAIGNLLMVPLASLYEIVGDMTFFFICAAVIFVANLTYFFIRRFYVYKEDRDTTSSVVVSEIVEIIESK